ncbi:MAG TPA: hypothetical protein VFI24_28520 [Pyrinomonadaceae bacterium]|nr:hypothetical protein [Pyrinomonadaceae bacterium]
MNVLFYLVGEGETLLFILVLLYLSECLIWVKRESVAFVSSWGGGWNLATPSSWLGNARGGLVFLNPLPPGGKIFLSHLSPVSISPAGVCALNVQTLPSGARSPDQTGEFLPFGKIKDAGVDGIYLTINHERFAKCATAKQARALALMIAGMVKAPTSKREGMARDWITKQFSTKDATARLQEAQAAIEPIQSLGLFLFLVLFVLTPVLGVIVGLMTLIVPVAIVMVGLAIEIAILFRRAHRQLYPHESSERLESLVKMILCPPVALRAADVITKNLLAEFSPIVLAQVLTGSDEKEFVRSVVLDLKHPLKHELSDKHAVETVTWSANEQLNVCLKHLELKSEELSAPAQREENSLSYCPRCYCQFLVAAEECPDCPGVKLMEF